MTTPSQITVYQRSDGAKKILKSAQFLASGGEANIYNDGQYVYKLYHNAAAARKRGLEQRFDFLTQSGLSADLMVLPTDLLVDAKGNALGLKMPYIQGVELVRCFTTPWRTQHGFGWEETWSVCQKMRSCVDIAHAKNIYMVDANEYNWMLHGTSVVAIDIDSWWIPGYPATAIVPSIEDPLVNNQHFNESSDWFSWAVVTFTLWTGIHPYKGMHPKYGKGSLQERMRDGVSIFNPEVQCPGALRSMDNIPFMLRKWYEDVFSHKTRCAPPTLQGTYAQAMAKQSVGMSAIAWTLRSSGRVQIDSPKTSPSPVRAIFADALLLQDGSWRDPSLMDLGLMHCKELKAFQDRSATVMMVGGKPTIVQRCDVPDIPADATLWSSNGRLFACVPDDVQGLWEYTRLSMGNAVRYSVSMRWGVVTKATRFYRNVFVQKMMGSAFLGVVDTSGIIQLRANYLDDLEVIDAFAMDAQTVWIAGMRKVDAQPVVLGVDTTTGVWLEKEVDTPDLLAALLPSGVGVCCVQGQLWLTRGNKREYVDAPQGWDTPGLRLVGSSKGLYAVVADQVYRWQMR